MGEKGGGRREERGREGEEGWLEGEGSEGGRSGRTFTETLSSESGVSMAKAMRMTWDFE